MSESLEQTNPIRWDSQGIPHSVQFRDKYFCTQNGYEENCHLLVQGHGLPEKFSALDPNKNGIFTVMETGFGTGLSFCCLWQLWDQWAPKSWSLHFVSLELYPLCVTDLDRALKIWPNLTQYRQSLVAKYHVQPGGIEHFDFEDQRIHLTIVFQDVVAALKTIYQSQLAKSGADVWLMNGFSPFHNPQMWAKEVFKGMALLSHTGTTVSSFTVAGDVRRGLEAAGFRVQRFAGYGTKKQMLRGWYDGIVTSKEVPRRESPS